MQENVNIKTLNVSKKNFFILWLEFLKPYHKLRNKEIEILALFLLKRDELSKEIQNDDILDKMLFSTEVRREIKEEMNYSSLQVVSNMLDGLRKKGVVKNDKIIKGLIPNLKESNNYKLILNFNIKLDET